MSDRGLFGVFLRLVPRAWRDSVRRDLTEEADRAGRRGLWRDFWLAGQALAVAIRFRVRFAVPFRERDRSRQRAMGGGIITDARWAARMLRADPWSTTAIAATLALGIGSATATYAVFNHVAFRPVPGVAEQNRLVTLFFQQDRLTATRAEASYAHLESMRDRSDALDGLAAWSRTSVAFGPEPDAPSSTAEVTRVSRGYFALLGVTARRGRLFSNAEYDERGHDILVVSERFARRLADGDGSVVGRDAYLNGRPFRIVGVTSGFHGLSRFGQDDVWTPYFAQLTPEPVADAPGVFTMIGRLRAGATIEMAQSQVNEASRAVGPVVIRQTTFGPLLFAGLTDGIGLTHARLMRVYRILMAGVVMLFLLGCANAANLLLARNIRRRRDFALRSAIGASRIRLVRQLSVEAAGLAALAAVFGLFAAIALTGVFRGTRLLSYLPAIDDLSIDWRVVAFCIAASIVTLAVFAVAPALMASRVDLHRDLREAGLITPRAGRLRSGLAAVQLALSLTLLACAGLMSVSVWKLKSLDLGMQAEDVFSFTLSPRRAGLDDERAGTVFRETLNGLEAAPGIRSAAVAWSGPFESFQRVPVRQPGDNRDAAIPEMTHFISPAYFDLLRIPFLAGRTFTAAENIRPSTALRPAVINEAFATKWFGTADAIGRTLTATSVREDFTIEIAGVVGNVRHRELRAGFAPMMYLPAGFQLRTGTVMVRSDLPPSQVAALARSVVHDAEPLLPVEGFSTIDEHIDVQLAEERLLARLGAVVAALAALLATTGLHGVIAFFVNERVREFGIHMALGASRIAVAASVFRRIGAILLVGLVTGVGLIFGVTRLLASRLYGVGPLDPVTIAGAAALLAGAAVIAAWRPARRATRIDPMAALRAD